MLSFYDSAMIEESDHPKSEKNAEQAKWGNVKILGWPVALALLSVLLFSHFNSARDVELSLAGTTLKVKGSKEDLAKILRLAVSKQADVGTTLGSRKDQESDERNLLLAVVDVIRSQQASDELGKEIVGIAKGGGNPFSWLEKKAIILPPSAQLRNQLLVCTDDKTFELWNRSIAYVWVDINDQASPESKASSPASAATLERRVDGRFDCDLPKYMKQAGSNDIVVIKSDSKELYDASRHPQALAHAIMRVRIPW